MDFFIDLLGWIGAATLLYAYISVSMKRMSGDSFAFQILNILGGILFMINTYYHHAYPSVFTNLVWVGIGVYTLIKKRKNTQNYSSK